MPEPRHPWLFVVLTPYHLLLSLLVSSTAPEGVRSDIVAPTTFAGFGAYLGEVERRRRHLGLWPGVRIEALPCPPTHRRGLAVAAAKVARRFARTSYGRAFVCHDVRAESLALALRARRRRVPVGTIEEGLGTYSRTPPPIPKASRAAVALTGSWVDRALVDGDRGERFGHLYAEAWCLAPELLPPGFRPARPVPADPQALAAAAAVLIGPDQLDLLPTGPSPDERPGIVVAPRSDNPLAPRCAELIERLADRDDRTVIAVKYHPRECEVDPLGVAGRPGFVLLEPSVPLEAYLLRRPAAFVVGPPSTTLLFTRRVLPEVPVASLDLTSELGQVLARAGVEPVEQLAV